MIKRFRTLIPSAAIFNCVLIFALSVAWASTTYTANRTFKKGQGGKIKLVSGQDKIEFKVEKGSLDPYFNQQNLSEMTIVIEMTEELVNCNDDCDDDDDDDDGGCSNGTFYRLEFKFSPNGAFFDSGKPAELMLTGKYVATNCQVTLLDETGEAVPAIVSRKKGAIIFQILEFSSYYYDEYNY